LRSAKEDPFIACDIITGFPGERQEDFEATYQLCQELDFAWIHAFPFSPRPGTEAYTLDGKVSEAEAGRRLDRLVHLAQAGKAAYINRWIGKSVRAVVEQYGPVGTLSSVNSLATKPQCLSLVTENYLKARLYLAKTQETGSPGMLESIPGMLESIPERLGSTPGKLPQGRQEVRCRLIHSLYSSLEDGLWDVDAVLE
ncbi:MAG: hypothetical protein SNJ56_03980, partial [Termitinemataceae bacterium]